MKKLNKKRRLILKSGLVSFSLLCQKALAHIPKLSPLACLKWKYATDKGKNLEEISESEWKTLNNQRFEFNRNFRYLSAVKLLESQKNEASFGYPVSNYRHCLQVATKVYRDFKKGNKIADHDINGETIVMSLFHDIGFTICNENHAKMAAEMLKPYLNEKNYWLLLNHDRFQLKHLKNYPNLTSKDKNFAYYTWGKDKKHPFYDYTCEWVKRYDQASMDPSFEEEPIETFIPFIKAFFEKETYNEKNILIS